MIALDTTVLVYAKGSGHPLRDPCRQLVDAIAGGVLEATTTIEVLQEFTHVRARRRDRADAAALARAYAELLAPLLVVNEDDLGYGLSLFEQTERLGAFDAVLAAAALRAGADCLVSAGRSFTGVPGLKHVFPDAAGIASLTRSPGA